MAELGVGLDRGGLAVLLGLLILPTLSFGARHHPELREHIGHEHVAPAVRYAAYPQVAPVYERVAETPQVIDGIYCYCDCSEHSGHYSLLDCFHDDHAARCDICLSEGDMAYRMHHVVQEAERAAGVETRRIRTWARSHTGAGDAPARRGFGHRALMRSVQQPCFRPTTRTGIGAARTNVSAIPPRIRRGSPFR